MTDYGYVNARVRSMRTNLLTREFFARLIEAEEIDGVNSLMEQTVYRREITEAILMDPEAPDYDLAFNQNLVASLKKIQDSTGGEPHRLVNLLLSRWDVLNIKTILRGKHGNVSSSDIANTLVPIGGITLDIFEEMIRQRDVADVIDVMGTLRVKYARPLTRSLSRYSENDEDLFVLELSLDKFYFEDALDSLKGKDKNVDMVRQMFVLELDMRNISTLMRIQEAKLDLYTIEEMWIPRGTISLEEFCEMGRLGDAEKVVGAFPDPEYRKILEKALPASREAGIVAFEIELEQGLIKHAVAMSNVDVLSIGVIIGYMWAKYNEIINLRIVYKGKLLGQPQSVIKKDLFFVKKEAVEAASA